ncbi:hypothetical protein E4T42_08606 [Aureobasidium subglaciale]|nr:hypothetical protein E4T42_08606 [Aureobasidium subglaciale]
MAGKPDYYGPPIPENQGAKRSLPEDIPQTSQKTPKANSGGYQDEASQSTSDESVTPEIQVQTQNIEVALCGQSIRIPDSSSHHSNLEHRPQRYLSDVPGPTKTKLLDHQASSAPPPTATPATGLASPPEQLDVQAATARAPTLYAQHAYPWGPAHPGSNQHAQSFPPYLQHVYYPTDRLHANPPANVTLATLPRYISHIDDLKVRDLLAISVVRHKDIHDMVQYEYERTTLERQSQEYEDASVLSFYKEHLEVQRILYGEYDDFLNPVKQEIVHRAFGSINETIMTIPSRVRPRSNWRTKFNAFLILVWIGRGIVDGIGMLPNEIRIQMAVDSRLVEAIEHVYETMSEEEILDDGVRLMEALVDLNNDRGACFDGMDSVVKMFKEVMRQGRNVVV